uniref:Seipin n=1 Tax=Heterorhabditis bacteriophora TaxID=37862 RepID=A0A1I7WWW5_HETBA
MKDDLSLSPSNLQDVRLEIIDDMPFKKSKSYSLPESKLFSHRRESKMQAFKRSLKKSVRGSLQRIESYAGRISKPANFYIRWNLLFTFLIFFTISSAVWIPVLPVIKVNVQTSITLHDKLSNSLGSIRSDSVDIPFGNHLYFTASICTNPLFLFESQVYFGELMPLTNYCNPYTLIANIMNFRAFFMIGYLIPWNINTMSIFSLTLDLFERGDYTHPGYQMDDIIALIRWSLSVRRKCVIRAIPVATLSGPTSDILGVSLLYNQVLPSTNWGFTFIFFQIHLLLWFPLMYWFCLHNYLPNCVGPTISKVPDRMEV